MILPAFLPETNYVETVHDGVWNGRIKQIEKRCDGCIYWFRVKQLSWEQSLPKIGVCDNEQVNGFIESGFAVIFKPPESFGCNLWEAKED